MSWFE